MIELRHARSTANTFHAVWFGGKSLSCRATTTRHGFSMKIPRRKNGPPTKAFIRKNSQIKKSGCWHWLLGTRRKRNFTYGRIKFNGRTHAAHRVSWMLFQGSIPDGMFVCHRCDNPICVNPKHLFIGTNADNIRDSSRKGRLHFGERNGSAKLTEAKVRRIRMLSQRGIKGKILARRFMVSEGNVSMIVNRLIWNRTPFVSRLF